MYRSAFKRAFDHSTANSVHFGDSSSRGWEERLNRNDRTSNRAASNPDVEVNRQGVILIGQA